MAKLWEKNYTLNKVIEKFTVGEDYLLDAGLVNSDCIAGIAHAAMLNSIGILTEKEFNNLKKELINIIVLNSDGKFKITMEDEDGHTAIENHLIHVLGDTGKKIHTGRSRNDQVIAALRLYTKGFLLNFSDSCLNLAKTLVDFAHEYKNVPMPGRTHMQIAMPSSVGLWAAAYAEELLDDVKLVKTAYELNDMSPLGSAASYGVPLSLDREMVAELQGFKKVQNNVLYVNNSRGKVESIVLDTVEQVVITLSKLAQDVILYSMPEFGYFSLPDELCSGSSIMPQKKNPCPLELARAKTSTVSACTLQVKSIIKTLPSGYNRDFQETKGPFMKGIETALACVNVINLTMEKLVIHEKKLLKGLIPEIYATDKAIQLVGEGMPFRDAYREVGLNIKKLKSKDPYQAIREKKHTGTTGNLGLNLSLDLIRKYRTELDKEKSMLDEKINKLTGMKVVLFGD